MRKVNDELLMTPAYWGFILVAILLLVIISLAYASYIDLKEREGGRKPVYSAIAILVLGSAFVGLMFITVFKEVQDIKKYGEQRTKYTVYVDGAAVDYDNVYLGGYSLYFADEEQKIIATTKR